MVSFDKKSVKDDISMTLTSPLWPKDENLGK